MNQRVEIIDLGSNVHEQPREIGRPTVVTKGRKFMAWMTGLTVLWIAEMHIL